MSPTLGLIGWGLRGRDQGWALAELLALEVIGEAASTEASVEPTIQPSFILDTSSNPPSDCWHVLEAEIFTKLSWLKTIRPRRLEQFEELCRQLAQLYQLREKSA